MSFTALRAIGAYVPTSVSGTAFRALYLIADSYDDGFQNADPSIEEITTLLGCSKRTTIRAIRELEKAGAVSVHVGGGRGHRSYYRIPVAERALNSDERAD